MIIRKGMYVKLVISGQVIKVHDVDLFAEDGVIYYYDLITPVLRSVESFAVEVVSQSEINQVASAYTNFYQKLEIDRLRKVLASISDQCFADCPECHDIDDCVHLRAREALVKHE